MRTRVPWLVSLLILISLLATSCGPAAPSVSGVTPAAPKGEPTTAPTKALAAPSAQPSLAPTSAPATSAYKEAPMLAELVKAGKLPPLAQRLPEKPMVVKGEKIGSYGGNWRMGVKGGLDSASFVKIIGYDSLVRWNLDWSGVEPNVAERYEMNKDATEYTFYLRKGIKWSDGQPFTADDIVFWYEDVVMNPEIANPEALGWYKVGGEYGKVTKLDTYTVKFTFKSPYGLFLSQIATPDGGPMVSCPRHWSSQFHIKYADKAKLEQAVKAAGFTNWSELFLANNGKSCGYEVGLWQASGRPTLNAWVTDKPYGGNATQVTFVRNPYYWKVDPEGQQYPYIDRLTYDVYQDIPAMLLKALNGEIDFQARHFNVLDNKAVLFDNQKKGDYRFIDLAETGNNRLAIQLNMTHKDKAMRQVFQNKDFRIGLSYALNRQEIIDTIYVGQGKPHQVAPLEGSFFYNQQFAKQYTEYSVAKANEYLDKAGLTNKDANGMRLRPDGKPFSFVLEVSSANKDIVDALNLIVKQWKAVGISVEGKSEDRTLLYQRKDNNDLDGMIWGGVGDGFNPMVSPVGYVPINLEAAYGVAWGHWYMGSGGTLAEEPPAGIKKLLETWDRLKATPGVDEEAKVMKELLQLSADQFLAIGVVSPPDGYGIAKNNFQNVPSRMIASWVYPMPGPANPFTFYFTK